MEVKTFAASGLQNGIIGSRLFTLDSVVQLFTEEGRKGEKEELYREIKHVFTLNKMYLDAYRMEMPLFIQKIWQLRDP